jgi:hypothetical protein
MAKKNLIGKNALKHQASSGQAIFRIFDIPTLK